MVGCSVRRVRGKGEEPKGEWKSRHLKERLWWKSPASPCLYVHVAPDNQLYSVEKLSPTAVEQCNTRQSFLYLLSDHADNRARGTLEDSLSEHRASFHRAWHNTCCNWTGDMLNLVSPFSIESVQRWNRATSTTSIGSFIGSVDSFPLHLTFDIPCGFSQVVTELLPTERLSPDGLPVMRHQLLRLAISSIFISVAN